MTEPTAPIARHWRWEHYAGVALLLVVATVTGCRPGLARELRDGLRIALLSRRDDVAAWQALRAFRPTDGGFQGVVLGRLLDGYARAGDRVHEQALAEQLPSQPAFAEAQPALMASYGRWLLAGGRADEAVPVLEAGLRRVASNDEQWVALRSELARAYDGLGRADAAEQLLQSLHTALPRSARVCRQLALHYADRSTKLDEAHTLAEQALRSARWDRLWHRRDTGRLRAEARYRDALGWVYARAEATDRAKELLLAAAHVFGDQPDSLNLYHLASVCFDRGEDNDALRLVNQCLALEPTYEPARLLRERIQGGGRRSSEQT